MSMCARDTYKMEFGLRYEYLINDVTLGVRSKGLFEVAPQVRP